jgi:hypothetical protein
MAETMRNVLKYACLNLGMGLYERWPWVNWQLRSNGVQPYALLLVGRVIPSDQCVLILVISRWWSKIEDAKECSQCKAGGCLAYPMCA